MIFSIPICHLLAPLRALSLVTVHRSSSTSLVVKWSHLQEEYFQGQPTAYKINYYPENLEREVNFWTVNYTTSAATLTNLTIYTLYTVKVSAVSSGGVGPANTVKAQTGAEGKKKLKATTITKIISAHL